MAGVNLTNAYITLIPSFEGAQTGITDLLVPAGEKAGDEAGKKSSGRFGGSFKKGMAAAGAVAVAGTVAAFKGLYEVGSIFDDVADTIRVGTGATGKDLEGLVGVAKNIGRTVPVEFDKIASTVADVNTRMGLSGDVLDTVASQYLNAGRILGEDVDIMKTGAAFNAFNIEGEAVSAGLDHLFQVSQATGIGMNELATSVAAQAPALQTLGFSFEEATAMVGSFDKAGLNSTALMSAMSKGMVTLAKDGEEPAEAFDRVVGEIDGFIKSGDQAAALDLASKVFGVKGASQFVGALESGAFGMDELGKAAGQTGDTIMGVAGETDDFAETWQLVKNNALLALEPLGSAVFDTLGSSLEKILPSIESFGAWLGDNTWAIQAFVTVLGGLAAGVIAVNVAMWLLAANPIALLIGAIAVAVAVLIAAVVLLWQNWDEVTAWIGEKWDVFVGWLTDGLEMFSEWWSGVWDGITEWWTNTWDGAIEWVSGAWDTFVGWLTAGVEGFSAWWNGIWDGVASWWSDTWSNIKEKGESAWKSVTDFFKAAGEKIANWFLNWTLPGLLIKHWDSIKSKATAAWNAILDFFKGIPGKITGFFKSVGELVSAPFKKGADLVQTGWDALMSFIRSIPSKVGSALSTIADKVLSPFKSAFNGVARAWNNTVGKISFKAPDWVPGMGGKGFTVPNIPMLATGGTATASGWSLVGEMGPELLHMPRGASVVPLDHPVSVNATSSGSGSSRADADYLARKLAELLAPFMDGANSSLDVRNNLARFATM